MRTFSGEATVHSFKSYPVLWRFTKQSQMNEKESLAVVRILKDVKENEQSLFIQRSTASIFTIIQLQQLKGIENKFQFNERSA